MPSVGLYPMQPLGEPSTSRKLLLYQERDIIGVENPGTVAAPTDFSGWSERSHWTRRWGVTMGAEHDTYGVHQTAKIASLFAVVVWDPQAGSPRVGTQSYVQDKADTGLLPTVGSGVISVAAAGGGLFTITLGGAYHFRSANLSVERFHMNDIALTKDMKDFSQVVMARVYLDTTFATTTTSFRVRRFEGTDPGTLAATDGSFCLAVHSS